MHNIFTSTSRTSRLLRVFVASLFALTAINITLPAANAIPGAPVISTITSSGTSGPVDVTVNFTRANPAAAQPAGYIYSTDAGATWAQCDSSNCTWNGSASSIIIKKLSSDTPRLQANVTYDIEIAECSTGRDGEGRETNANILNLSLQTCGTYSSNISYVAGTSFDTSAPVISVAGSISYGASGATLTVTGTKFETSTSLSLFTINVGTTGLTAASVSWTNATEVVFTFSGTAAMGSISIQAKTSAYAPVASSTSNTVSKSVTAVAPGTPTNLDTTTVRGTEVALSWTAPTSNGGANISNYVIEYSSNNGSSWSAFAHSSSTATSINVTGLSSSTSYLFRVAAVNSVGTGSFTSSFGPVTTLTPPVVPETPTAVTASGATSNSLSVSWSAPSVDGGATIDVYQLERSTDGINWTLVSATATSPYSVTGLSASTSYTFKVRAHNSVGWGPYSDSSTAVSTSAASSTPSTPTPIALKIYPPKIEKLSKDKVCARGDEKITIHGDSLSDASVTIDGNPVKIRNNSSQAIGITLDEGLEGLHTIKVTTLGGSDSISIVYKLVDKTAFKVFDIPYIYKGGSFFYQFEAFGENTFRVTGNMPAGLVLNAETGEISGIPTEEGKFNFVLHADGLCGNDSDVIKLDVDKEIPNAISYRIKFSNPKSKKIVGTAAFELNKFLREIKEISPRQIQPVIYITGGAPENEPEVDSQSAKDRRDSLCDLMIKQDVIGQTVLGLFDGEEGEIEIFVYWPVVR